MKKYISSLDGLRGFGIIFVVLYHSLRMKGADYTIIGFSWIFIQMFFVQSGFLITKILLQNRKLAFKEYLKRFYWNRILRIFPIYFLYIFILIGIYLSFNVSSDFLSRLPYLLTYTYNFTRFFAEFDFYPLYVHLWSLSVEEQFYLIWPFFIFFLSRQQMKVVIILLLLLCPVIRFGLGEYLTNNSNFSSVKIGEAIYGFTLSHFDSFAIGSAIALFEFKWLKRNLKKVLILFSFLFAAILFVNQYSISNGSIDLSWTSLGIPLAALENYQHVWSFSLVNVLFFLMILILIRNNYSGVFNNQLLVSMGKVVYSTYIFHFIILIAFAKIFSQLWFPFHFLICLFASCGVGLLSYHYFEKRFLRYKY